MIVGSANIVKFINQTLPHLIVKKDKASECLDYTKAIVRRKEEASERIRLAVQDYINGNCCSINAARHKYHVAEKTINKYLKAAGFRKRDRSETCKIAAERYYKDNPDKNQRLRSPKGTRIGERRFASM